MIAKALKNEMNNSETNLYVKEKFENFNIATSDFGKKYRIQESPYSSCYHVPELNLGIVAINTSWLSTGGLVREDKGHLAVSDVVLQTGLNSFPDTLKKIIIGHHPLSDMMEFNERSITAIMQRHAAAYLHGHLHESEPTHTAGAQGSIFVSQCGALYSGVEYFNGYSILSFDTENDHVEVNMRSFYPKRQCFDKALDICENGQFYSSNEAKVFWQTHPGNIDFGSIFTWLKGEYKKSIHQAFDIGFYKDSLSEVFVEPIISNRPENLKFRGEENPRNDQNISSIADLAKDKDNLVIHAGRETGKTSLLQKLAIEIIERSEQSLNVPLIINFKELKLGRDQILRSLKQAVHPTDLPEGFTVQQLLKMKVVTIIVDDVNNRDAKKLKQLMDFIKEHEGNRVVLCADGGVFESFGTAWVPDTKTHFSPLFLHCFSTNKLRELVEKWTKTNNAVTNEKILDRICKNLVEMNIPRTPVMSSIILAILDKNSEFSPINRAVMIEQFVETLLGKGKADEARRETFDYRNKEHYLAFLASKMVTEDTYSYSRIDLSNITSDYFKLYGFSENTDQIINLLIAGRIFSESDGEVRFKYRSVCEYFIAKQMADDEQFRSKILDSDDYLMYQNEIECLSGIKRNDVRLLNQVRTKFFDIDEEFKHVDVDLGAFNELNIHCESSKKLLSSIDKSLNAKTMTNAERDEILDTNFPKDIGQKQDMYRPIYNDKGHKWIGALMMYSRVLKNTEIMSEKEKKDHLFSALSKWATLALWSIHAVPILVEHKKMKINGQTYEIVLSPNTTDEDLFHHLCLAAGLASGALAKSTIATEKLEPIFLASLTDKDLRIIGLYQAFTLLHMSTKKGIEALRKVIKNIKDSNYLLELTIVEVSQFVRMKALERVDREALLNILGDSASYLNNGVGNGQKFSQSQYKEKIKKQALLEQQRSAVKSK